MIDLALEREKKNITQQKLSEKVGVTRQMISAIELRLRNREGYGAAGVTYFEK